jgi:hypothetical protein
MDARAVIEAPMNGTPSQLLCPFDLQMWAIDRMLNFEITDDPHYQGLELQVFDDPATAGAWPSCSGGETTGAWTSTGSPA